MYLKDLGYFYILLFYPLHMQVESDGFTASTVEEPKAAENEELERGGYECEFVEEPPAELQTKCAICLQILREPHKISCCSQCFCKSCISKLDGKCCPLCRNTDFVLTQDEAVKKSLNDLNVCCINAKSGCNWIGKLQLLNEHLSEKLLEGCDFTKIKCIHCGHYFQRSVLVSHLTEECSKWPKAIYKGMYHYHVNTPHFLGKSHL